VHYLQIPKNGVLIFYDLKLVFRKEGLIKAKQLHKKFSDKQVKSLLETYLSREIAINYILVSKRR